MPTIRLPNFRTNRQRTESKENLISPLLGKLAGRGMPRKRSRSDPGDANNADVAVLRLSQEANNSGNDVDAGENVNQSDGEQKNNRNVKAAKLYAQSLQKANARRRGNCKRIKLSPADTSVVDQLVSEDGKVGTASFGASKSQSQTYVNGLGASVPSSGSTVSTTQQSILAQAGLASMPLKLN